MEYFSDKKGHFMLIKESVYQQDITIQIYLKEHIPTLFFGNSPICMIHEH